MHFGRFIRLKVRAMHEQKLRDGFDAILDQFHRFLDRFDLSGYFGAERRHSAKHFLGALRIGVSVGDQAEDDGFSERQELRRTREALQHSHRRSDFGHD